MKTVFAAGMIFLSTFSFGQSQGSATQINNDVKSVQPTYLDFFFSGVSTTLNYGNLNKSLTDFKKDARGVQIGVSLQAGISHSFSLVTELALVMKGGKLKENNPLTDKESILRFYGVEVPVLARVHIGKFHLNAGPSVAYTFYGTQKLDGTTTDLSFKNSIGDYKRFEAGVQFGGGYTFLVKQKRVSLDVRYCYGLTNISYDKEVYNRSLVIRLHISKKA
ncbi:MAG: PorT family protein [Saprospiraceae bacterium]|uniref:PorT family protein n=1 Tax=Candidatus Opimibacter skivensis TaxID=2982028 RepID=A0A9D7SZT7_9BACT|nr:PorT family protein [Candidatus Opimibacter skivensis]